MPDISQQASLAFWKEYPDPTLFRVLALMESMEDWVHDGNPVVEESLTQLGDALEGITKFELKEQDAYIQLGNHIHISRILRIMQSIDTTHPGSASSLLMYAENNTQNNSDPAGLFLKRNIAFERLRLLSRVFSPERLELVQHALEKEEL